MNRSLLRSSVTRLALAAGTAFAAAAILSSNTIVAQQAGAADSTLHTMHVQGKVYMVVGDGGNITFQVGDDGVLLVDTGTAAQAPALIAEIKKIAGTRPIRWILNTTLDADHIGGNVALKEAGDQIVAGNF